MSGPALHRLPIKDGDGKTVREIAYAEWGMPENPPVFCVHGLTRNGRDFDFLAEALSADSRVICPDMAGRGESDWLEDESTYHYGTYMADLLALMAHCGIEYCQWVGTSMGGILGMTIAAMQPEKISAMVLNDIGAVVAKEGLARIASYAGTRMNFTNRVAAEAYLRILFAPFGIEEEAHWRHLLAHSIEPEGEGFRLRCDPRILANYGKETNGFTEITDIDLQAVWSAVTCPVLVLRGESSDILRAETLEAMKAARADIETAVIKNTGHAPSLMKEAEIRLVTEWLRRHR